MRCLRYPSSRSAKVYASLLIPALLLVSWLASAAIGLVAFFHLFDGRHSGIRITQAEAADAHNAAEAIDVIPRIIHQIFFNWTDPANDNIPGDWDAVRHTCIEKHPDWEYKLWTGTSAREFIAREYPTFLRTYDGYKYPVQKVDAVRYFLMLHYGGIYLDMDNGCATTLDALLRYPVFLTDGGQGALSNNILGSRPHHPFWELVTQQLPAYDVDYVLPYPIISYASGQWFLTDMWERYHGALPARDEKNGDATAHDDRLYQLMMDGRQGADPWVFFTQGRGGTWDNWDNHFFGWLGHLEKSLPTIFGIITAIGVFFWVLRRRTVMFKGYQRLNQGGEV